MKLVDCFNLPDYVILPQELEKPMNLFILQYFNLPNIFHIRINPNPQHRVILQLSRRKNVFCLKREVFKLEFVHFELPNIIVKHHLGGLHVRVACRNVLLLVWLLKILEGVIEVFFLGWHGSLDFSLERNVRGDTCFEFF